MNEEPGAVFDAHVRAEFVECSVDATMATMTDAPYVTHVPVMTGGHGRNEVRAFYENWFVGHWPADTQVTQASRTVGQGRVIDELVVSFTTTWRCRPCCRASHRPATRLSCRTWC